MRLLTVICIGAFLGSSIASASKLTIRAADIIKIQISDENMPEMSTRATNRQLRRRVRQLERAVQQMQAQVYNLQIDVAIPSRKTHTCFIKTTFHGTVSGTAGSLAEAKAKAMKACDTTGSHFSCETKNLNCE